MASFTPSMLCMHCWHSQGQTYFSDIFAFLSPKWDILSFGKGDSQVTDWEDRSETEAIFLPCNWWQILIDSEAGFHSPMPDQCLHGGRGGGSVAQAQQQLPDSGDW